MGKPKNKLDGQRFGMWAVIADSGQRKGGNIIWVCRCDCGVERLMRADNLKRGASKSCGCDTRESHGMAGSKTYQVWAAMWKRTTNPNDSGYKNYMARGISVCERWRSFSKFLEDMGEVPSGKFIDRIDNDKGYSPDNCRWATRTENNRNRRSCRYVYFRGQFRRLWDIAEMVGMKTSVIRNRLNNYQMTIDEAVTMPLHAKPRPCGDYI